MDFYRVDRSRSIGWFVDGLEDLCDNARLLEYIVEWISYNLDETSRSIAVESLRRGYNVEPMDLELIHENSRMVAAARFGRLDIINLYFDKTKVNPAIIEAVRRDRYNVVERLLSLASNEQECMTTAIMYKRFGMVKFLLSKGVMPDEPTIALSIDHENILEMFMKLDLSLSSALNSAAFRGSSKALKMLLENRAGNVDIALLSSSYNDDPSIVEMLIDHGATNLNGALMVACYNCNINTMKSLVNGGATDLNFSLIVSAEKGCLDAVKYLVERGATWIDMALIKATNAERKEVVDYLHVLYNTINSV